VCGDRRLKDTNNLRWIALERALQEARVMKTAILVMGMVGVVQTANAEPPHDERPRAEVARVEPPRTVVSINVLDLAQETFALALDYRLGQHVAVRGELGYDSRRSKDDRFLEYSGGVQVAFGFRFFPLAAYKGPFVDAELKRRMFSAHDICNTGPSDRYINYCDDPWLADSIRLRVGWQHTFAFRLSVAAAIGIGHEWTKQEASEQGYEYSETQFVREIRVGYAF
jgi:hypothetical protein